MSTLRRVLYAFFIAALLTPAVAQEGALPAGPGAELVYAKCQQCHPLRYVTESAGLPDFLWADTISLMVQLGMQVTAEEEELLYSYLTTYLGMNPPPEPAENDAVAAVSNVDPVQAYATNCSACHGADGAGQAGGFPPIVGHASQLAQADRDYLVNLVLYGVTGPITVAGNDYNGMMPGWSHLSDDQIAAILNHVVADLDPSAELPGGLTPYTPEEIAGARGAGLDANAVYESRPSLP